MRKILVFVSLIDLVACHRDPTTPGEPVPDAPTSPPPDAGADGPPANPHVAPCEVLGLPGAPSWAAGGIHPTLADVDGDGKLDLIVAGTAAVTVSPGRGDATFGAAITSSLPGTASALAVADVNADGKRDLIASFDGGFVVALGDGSGRFAQGPLISAAPFPKSLIRGLATADLNGDGKLDLVVAYPFQASVGARLGHGDGTFGGETLFAVGDSPSGMAVADLDGDSVVDVIVTRDSSVTILHGNGDGTFAAKVSRDAAPGSQLVAATDLNGDGKVDLVVGGDRGISVLMNDGQGAFHDHVDYLSLSGGEYSRTLVVADVNQDGKLDVVAATLNTMDVFPGNGDGTFPRAVTTRVPGLAELAVGNVDGDPAVDVIVSSADGGASALESDGRGGFLSPTQYAPTASGYTKAADLNGDGYVDVVVAGYNSVGVALGKGDRRFADLVSYPVGGGASIRDVTGDGVVDIVMITHATTAPGYYGISVLPGNGDGSFRDATETALDRLAPINQGAPATLLFAYGDLDGDGKLDVVVANNDGAWLGLVAVYLGNGDGSFRSKGDFAMLDGRPVVLQLEDVNGDGRLDVVAAHQGLHCEECVGPRGTDGIAAFVNEGDGTLQPAVPYTGTGGLPPGPLRVDITGDGTLDTVTMDENAALHIVPGDGTSQPALIYPAGAHAIAGPFSVADVDNDGRLDVITSGSNGFSVLYARCVR